MRYQGGTNEFLQMRMSVCVFVGDVRAHVCLCGILPQKEPNTEKACSGESNEGWQRKCLAKSMPG